MDVQPRIDVLLERQQAPLIEGSLVISDVIMYEPHSTSAPGVNSTFFVALDDGSEAFHKPFSGINVNAAALYGQHPDSVPLNECAAWRLASSLGGLDGDSALLDLNMPVVSLRSGETIHFADEPEEWARSLVLAYRSGDLVATVLHDDNPVQDDDIADAAHRHEGAAAV